MMRLCEIYKTISGEGTTIGRPITLVRLAGCPEPHCTWCDSKYSWAETGEKVSPVQVVERVKWLNPVEGSWVLVTGGEPLMQRETLELIVELLKGNCHVILETSGRYDVSAVVRLVDVVDMDVKCPSSGVSEYTLLGNLEQLEEKDEVKFVVSNVTDYDYARWVMSSYRTRAQVLISPAWGMIDPKLVVDWMLRDMGVTYNWRLSLQIHKVIWSPDQRRV